MSSHEFTEWQAFSLLEPFGYEQEMTGHAITACTVSNRLRGEKEDPGKVGDFIPQLEYDKKEGDPVEKQIQTVEMILIGAGGKDLRTYGKRTTETSS
jgi:hypothetical protein